MTLAKYDTSEIQDRWTTFWETNRYFHSEPSKDRKPYSIVIPPPNVTGALHLGHALNGTIQDILIRTHRMMGFETLWMPGADHAGIATQAVVEKRFSRKKKKTATTSAVMPSWHGFGRRPQRPSPPRRSPAPLPP